MQLFPLSLHAFCVALAVLSLALFLCSVAPAAAAVNASTTSSASSPALAAYTKSQREHTRRFLLAFAMPGSLLQSWWGTGDFCEWRLITCEADGVHVRGERVPYLPPNPVVRLPELPSNVNGSEVLLVELSASSWLSLGWGFGGSLPASWSQLSHLRVVEADTKLLSGTLPASWGQLHRLKSLRLSYAPYGEGRGLLTGTLPEQWASMASLTELNVECNRLVGTLPASWSAMAALQAIYLDRNALTGTLPPEWAVVSGLQYIWLHENELTGSIPEGWVLKPQLDLLSVYGNNLDGPFPGL